MEAPFRYLAMPGRPLLTRHAVFLLGRPQEFPAQKACAELDFDPKVSVDEGIARSVDWLKRRNQTLRKRLEREHCVQSPEGERVRKAGLNPRLSCLIGNHIQVTRGRGCEKIRRRRKHAFF